MKYLRNHLLSQIIIFLISVIAGWYLFLPGYFSMHDDLQVTRQYQMDLCFKDYQIPCRWSPDLGGGHGFPLFNFYSPLPNYIGQVFVLLGYSYIEAIKYTFFLALWISAIGMYLLVFEISKQKTAAILASIAYIWAPYHAVDIFVRGALAESWALAWFPFIIWSIIDHSKKQKIFSPQISFFIAALLLSHNLMSMWFAPVIGIISITTLYLYDRITIKKLLILVCNGVLGLGLAAFFVLPALSEQKYVHTQTLTQDYFNYQNHYVSFFQLFFDRNWEYGASVWGPDDDMSFQLGWPHWWILAGIGVITIISIRKSKFHLDVKTTWIAVAASIWLIAIFMTHAKSVKIWEFLPFLAITQFPWRLLAIAIFANALIIGVGFSNSKKHRYTLFILCVVLICALNWNYFKPSGYDAKLQDSDKLSGPQWPKQQRAAFLDYLPKTVTDFELPVSDYQVRSLGSNDQYRVENFLINSNKFSLDIFNDSQHPITVKIPIFDFPGWKILINNQLISHTASQPEGFITIDVPPQQKSIIQGWLTNTKIRTIGNSISLISYLGIILMLVVHHRTRNHPTHPSI